tara:strand:- start:349 stop:618 length:270 start_codon:yes stop_codon:yes gene_type:complete
MAKNLLKKSEIDVTNIRSEFYRIETIVQEIEQNFKNGISDKAELDHWKESLEFLLSKMTSEQRSLVMDDFEEIPSIHQKLIQTVKSQET